MDGRISALVLFGLVLACSGCVTTQEKKVTVRTDSEASPTATAPAKEERKPAPATILLAYGKVKERDADELKDNPEAQARLRDEARRAYQEVLKTKPDHVEASRALARIYVKMGDYQRAQETYQKALAKQPRDVNLWYDLGMMHDRRKNWQEGARCFHKALEIDPENQLCLKALGFTLARAGQLDQSLLYLTRAMGSSASAHYNVALMLMHLAEQESGESRGPRMELARQHLRIALQDNPAYEDARTLLVHLESQPGNTLRGTVEIQFADPGH